MALSVLVIDDEPLARRRLEQHLEKMSEVKNIGSASGCVEGANLVAKLRPDVVLLDIKMRDGTGFDLIEMIEKDRLPLIIFVTAFDRHAVRAFEASATDFLVKPVEFQRLRDALQKAEASLRQRERADLTDDMEEIVANLRSQLALNRSEFQWESEFWVRHRVVGFVRVPVSDIQWLESEDDYVSLVTAQGSYLLRGTLKDMESRLDPQLFARIHRSTIVRLSMIERFVTEAGNMMALLNCGARLRVGRPQAKRLRAALGKLERLGYSKTGTPLQRIGSFRSTAHS